MTTPGKSQLDRDIDRQVMTLARLTRHAAPARELTAARQQLAGLVLRRHVTRALATAGQLSPAQRAQVAAEILHSSAPTAGAAPSRGAA